MIKGELVFKDVIKESILSCMGREKYEQLLCVDVKLRLSRAELMFGSTLIMLEILCWNKLENKEQRTESGWAVRHLVCVLPTKVKDNL